MTTCVSIRPLLSALVDSELSADQAEAVRTHLESCDLCRKEWESLVSIDHQLSRVLSVPESAIARCHNIVTDSLEHDALWAGSRPQPNAAPTSPTIGTSPRTASWPVSWPASGVWLGAGILAAAAAAILLLAQIQPDAGTGVGEHAIIARLVRATGPVQVRKAGSSYWASVLPESQEPIHAGSRVRTSRQVLCELETVDQGRIRLNESAEVIMQQPDRLQLVSGQLWCQSPGDAAMEVDVEVSTAKIKAPQIATMACPSSSEIQCVAESGFASCASVSSANAASSFSTGSFSCAVAPGESVSVDAHENISRQDDLGSANKIWQLPLLAASGKADEELVASLSQLLAPIGMSKATHLNEQQLRALGPAGAIPLLVYATSESSQENPELRRKAVRLASNTADERSIALLRQLSADADPQIAKLASATLEGIAQSAGGR